MWVGLGKLENLTLDLVKQLRDRPASGASAARSASGASGATRHEVAKRRAPHFRGAG